MTPQHLVTSGDKAHFLNTKGLAFLNICISFWPCKNMDLEDLGTATLERPFKTIHPAKN
jgi:hypothetical protein